MDLTDIRVFKVNESHIRIETNPQINQEIKNSFSARPPNFQFMPAYRSGRWDGFIRFYKTGNKLPIGLLDELKLFAEKGEYSLYQGFDDELDIKIEDFKKFVELLEIPFEVRDYQIAAAHSICCKKRESLALPTGSGKSLVAYIVLRFLQVNGLKALLVVPRTSLVEQMYSDFYEYGWADIDEEVHRIYSGKDKTYDKDVIITTWQSIANKDYKYKLTLSNDETMEFHQGTYVKLKNGKTKKAENLQQGDDINVEYYLQDKK